MTALTSNIVFMPREYLTADKTGGLSAIRGVNDRGEPLLVFIQSEDFKNGGAEAVAPSVELFADITNPRAVAGHPDNGPEHQANGGTGGMMLLSRVAPEPAAEKMAIFLRENPECVASCSGATPVSAGWAVPLRAGAHLALDPRAAKRSLAKQSQPIMGLSFFEYVMGDMRIQVGNDGIPLVVEEPTLLQIPPSKLRQIPEYYDALKAQFLAYRTAVELAHANKAQGEAALAAQHARSDLLAFLASVGLLRMRNVFLSPENAMSVSLDTFDADQLLSTAVTNALNSGTQNGLFGGVLIQPVKGGKTSNATAIHLVRAINKSDSGWIMQPSAETLKQFMQFGGGTAWLTYLRTVGATLRITPTRCLNVAPGKQAFAAMSKPSTLRRQMADTLGLRFPSNPMQQRVLQYTIARPALLAGSGNLVLASMYPLSPTLANACSDLTGLNGSPATMTEVSTLAQQRLRPKNHSVPPLAVRDSSSVKADSQNNAKVTHGASTCPPLSPQSGIVEADIDADDALLAIP